MPGEQIWIRSLTDKGAPRGAWHLRADRRTDYDAGMDLTITSCGKIVYHDHRIQASRCDKLPGSLCKTCAAVFDTISGSR
jgi:hypothetical protein